VKIILADDHPIVRKGLKLILSRAYPHAFIEEVGDGEELLLRLKEHDWNVILSDISMPGISGVAIVTQIKKCLPETPVLILSTHPAEEYAVPMFKAGASGYLTKETAPEELVKALDMVMGGKKYITPEVAELLAESEEYDLMVPVYQNLSKREFEVFKHIAEGRSIAEIAGILSLDIYTISTCRLQILVKMHMHHNADIIKYAIKNQLL